MFRASLAHRQGVQSVVKSRKMGCVENMLGMGKRVLAGNLKELDCQEYTSFPGKVIFIIIIINIKDLAF